MIHSSYYRPRVLPVLADLAPGELDRLQDLSASSTLNRTKIEEIGRDGLIAEKGIRRGLLLPQVPVSLDRNWSQETFLEHTCQKAWLPKDAWKDKETKVYSFQAILFEEKSPRGEVVRKNLK